MTKKKKIPKSVVISAIAGLVVLECAAMYFGIDGKLFALIVAVIAGLAGLALPSPIKE